MTDQLTTSDPVKAALELRAGGRCELPIQLVRKPKPGEKPKPPEVTRCRNSGGYLDFSHRVRASQGGERSIPNGLYLCRFCHDWLDAHREVAVGGGWQLEGHEDPATAPVYLLDPWSGWWLIEEPDDGGEHVLVPFELELSPPVLPRFSAA